MKPETAIRLTNKIFNPLILWCYGWKRRRPKLDLKNPIHWKHPETGHWWSQKKAIQICENDMCEPTP